MGIGTEFREWRLPLESAYRWERERARCAFLDQPGGGKVRTWTWGEAMDEARRVAAYLAAQNWPAGSKVAILSKNCAWWMMADLAIWMAGHASVPVYPSLRPASVRQILEHSGARLCFTGATDEREAAALGIPEGVGRMRFPTASASAGGLAWDEVIARNAPIPGHPERGADELATIIYTSGTTGAPKGAMHTFRAIGFAGWTLSSRFSFTAEERFFSYLPLAHIFERAGTAALALHLGCQMFFTEGVDTFLADLKRAKPTAFLAVPRLLFKFQEGVLQKVEKGKLEWVLSIPVARAVVKRKILARLGLDTVRHAACGGAPLPLDLLHFYRQLGLDLAEGYGTTESMITHVPAPGHARPGYVGDGVTGVETKIGPEGEVLVKSPMNAVGYYQDPAGTREMFTEDGFYRTGDKGELAPDGQLKLVGRIKDLFKTSKGKYVAPGPIECKLAAHPSIEACCLMGAGQPSSVAIVLLSEETRRRCLDPAEQRAVEHSLSELLDRVNAELDAHERIAFMVVADGPWTIGNGLLTPTLKLRRSALEPLYGVLTEKGKEQGRRIIWESTPGPASMTAA